MTIQELMLVDHADRDYDWLVTALGDAVELELATLPLYLTALWSIDDGHGPATKAITTVVKEEMLHMVLAGNMLSAIGGSVRLKPPSYPGHLPGNVMPDLDVPLTALSPQTLKNVFMAIEYPEGGPVTEAPDPQDYARIEAMYARIESGEYPSIGAFYDAIGETFRKVDPALRSDFQLTGTVGGHSFDATDTSEKVHRAITEIKEQGEGTSLSPFTDPGFGSELSHFYRFAEVYHGARIVNRDGRWVYEGDPVPFPVVYPMGPVPQGGYTDENDVVQKLVDDFNASYGSVLNDLEAAWATPHGNDLLGKAVGEMFDLQQPAQALMKIERPDDVGTYGPDWRA